MELRALWDFLRRRGWLILLPFAVALVLSLPSLPAMLSPETAYATGLRFTAAAPSDSAFVGADAAAASSETLTYEDSVYVPWLASEYIVVNLPQWITSDSFAREVSDVLATQGLTLSAEDIRAGLAADSARSILVLYLTWSDEAEAQAIAEAAIQVLQTRNQVYFPQFAAFPAEVVPLDEVRINAVAPPLTTRFAPFLRLGIALMAGVLLAGLAEYLDDTLRGPEDIANSGLTLYGAIPSE